MKLLLDMGLSLRVARLLCQQGHDAVHLVDQGLRRLPDPEIVRKAKAEGRVIVTFDLDFPALLALGRLAQPSAILFRLERCKTDQLAALALDVLASYEDDLKAGAIVVVEEDRIRVRSLPVWE